MISDIINRFQNLLFKKTESDSLVIFRIGFGIAMLYESARHFTHLYYHFGWPMFHFSYPFFNFIKPFSMPILKLLTGVMGFSTLGIIFGRFQRLSLGIFSLIYTYFFLLDRAYFNNHYYMAILLGFLLLWIGPITRKTAHYFWHTFILRAQIIIVYFYSGIAKFDWDWLAGYPLTLWLGNPDRFPLLGPLFSKPIVPILFNWGSLFFDLFIGFLLLYRKTRIPAIVAAISFHLFNSTIFSIGFFPFFMIVSTIIFIDPASVRKCLQTIKLPSYKGTLSPTLVGKKVTIVLLSLYLIIQFTFPLRHYFYPGNTSWHEEGNSFSWRMKIRAKQYTLKMVAITPINGIKQKIDPTIFLNKKQIVSMSYRPFLLVQFSHFIEGLIEESGLKDPVINAYWRVSLNGRPSQFIIDPNLDLTKVKNHPIKFANWILPLNQTR